MIQAPTTKRTEWLAQSTRSFIAALDAGQVPRFRGFPRRATERERTYYETVAALGWSPDDPG